MVTLVNIRVQQEMREALARLLESHHCELYPRFEKLDKTAEVVLFLP